MKMTKATPIALAVAAAFALTAPAAFAHYHGGGGSDNGNQGQGGNDNPDPGSGGQNGLHIGMTKNFTVTGNLELDPQSDVEAIVGTFDADGNLTTDPSQEASNNTGNTNTGNNNANMAGKSGAGSSGNVGANVAAGDNNVQANKTALAAADANTVFDMAQAFVSQSQESNENQTTNTNVDNGAGLKGGALSGASGNVLANVASGSGNLQENAVAIAAAGSGVVISQLSMSQSNQDNNVTNSNVNNTALIGGSALSGASGNIGASVAAGTSNLQSNVLTIAAGSGTGGGPVPQ